MSAIHTLISLDALPTAELRKVYEQIVGKKPVAKSREQMVVAILAAQAAQADGITDTDTEAVVDTDTQGTAPEVVVETVDFTDAQGTDNQEPEVVVDTDTVATATDSDPEATDQEPTPEATPEPAAPPVRVCVQGSGGNTGSVLMADLITRTGSVAVVQVLGKEIRFGITDGEPTRVPKSWGTGGWRLDTSSLPEIKEPTVTEMASMRARDLSIEQLQQVYGHLSGRPTDSTTRSYLLWKIAQAKAGNLPTGSGRRARGSGEPMRVVPVAMPVSTVERLDEAWTRAGYTTRISFIRSAISQALREHGEVKVAKLFEPPSGE